MAEPAEVLAAARAVACPAGDPASVSKAGQGGDGPGLTVWLEPLLALDAFALLPIAHRHGFPVDAEAHRREWAVRLAAWPASGISGQEAFLTVGTAPGLRAYAWLRRQGQGEAFVLALVIHPKHRSAGVTRALLSQVSRVLGRWQVRALHSHVFRGNDESLAFHQRLGFEVMQSNPHAHALRLDVPAVPARWTRAGLGLRP